MSLENPTNPACVQTDQFLPLSLSLRIRVFFSSILFSRNEKKKKKSSESRRPPRAGCCAAASLCQPLFFRLLLFTGFFYLKTSLSFSLGRLSADEKGGERKKHRQKTSVYIVHERTVLVYVHVGLCGQLTIRPAIATTASPHLFCDDLELPTVADTDGR